MLFLEQAAEKGINVDDALQRFMGNEALLEKMLKKLPETVYPSRYGGNGQDLEVAAFLKSGDTTTALANAHTLKGIMGNLSITGLYQAYTDIVTALREGRPTDAEDILTAISGTQKDLLEFLSQ